MAMVVKNNMSAVKTLNTLNKNSAALQKSLAKVSSGMKINSAQDDASGYAISERMRVQIRSLDQANQNTQNASSLMKTAEGAVSSTVEILKSLKEKAINAATDTNTDADRATIQKELDQFIDQIDDNALTTFNGKYLVDGSKGQSGAAVATAFTNQSLEEGTDGSTKLTALANRNGDSLEIESTDSITASFVKNGKTYTTIYEVGNTTLEQVFQNLNTFKDEDGNAVTAFGEGSAPAGGSSTKTLDALKGVTATYSNLTAVFNGASIADLQGIANADLSSYDNVNALSDTQKALLKSLKGLSGVDSALSTAETAAQNWLTKAWTAAGNNRSTAYSVNGATPTAAGSWTTNNPTSAVSTVMTALKAVDVTNSSVLGTSSDYKIFGIGLGGDQNTANIRAKNPDPVTQSTGMSRFSAYLGANETRGTAGGPEDPGDNSNYLHYKLISEAVSKANSAVTTKTEAGSAPASTSSKALVVNSNQIGTDTFKDPVYTADGTSGVTVTAATAGINGQISGLTLSITDSEGNVKKSANAALDDFRMTIYARNDSSNNELTFQVGAKANQSITVGLDDMRSEALGLKGSDGSKVSVATQDKANAAVSVFDNAIQKALDQQATIGAIEARLEYTSQNLTTSSENVQAAESTIRDADMAKEMTNYTKNNVLLQAAQSMLAQANQNSSAVLSLLQ